MTHLALIYGTPPVVLRRRHTKSIDQFLVKSLGFPEMLTNSHDDYVALVAKLARNPAQLSKVSDKIKKAAQRPIFVANPKFSRDMQTSVEKALKATLKRQKP